MRVKAVQKRYEIDVPKNYVKSTENESQIGPKWIPKSYNYSQNRKNGMPKCYIKILREKR